MREIRKQAVVAHSAEQMFNLVNRVEDYPEFLPYCDATQVLSRDEDEVQASITVGSGGISKSFTTHNRLQTNKMIEIRLIDGPFKHLEGFWRFEPLEDGKSRIALDLEFELAGGLLDMMFGPVFYQIANTFVDAFCQRAEKVYENA